MVTRETQLPLCPVCHKADKVKKLETAYNEGLERFAPPPMPGKTVSVVRYMVSSMILVGLFIFLILVLVGSESFGQGFSFVELALVVGATASIVAARARHEDGNDCAGARLVRARDEAVGSFAATILMTHGRDLKQ